MYIANQLGSIWDEKSSASDSFIRSSLYKIQAGWTSYGSFPGGDLTDYYEISPGIGQFRLVVTSDPANASSFPGTWGRTATAFDIKITDQAGNVLLNADAVGPDGFTDSISFTSNSSVATYQVEIRNSLFDTFNYAATLVPLTASDTVAPVAPKLVTTASFNTLVNPQVTFRTSLGNVVFELDTDNAPVTVANMLAYVNTGYYDGTLFHRVIPGFVAQGGGFTSGMVARTPTYQPIVLESNNGLLNLRGTVAMARTSAPDSATSQFFVNLVDNGSLDYSSAASPGYAVFAYTVSGMSVIDLIAQQPTTTVPPHSNVPVGDVTILSAQQTLAGSATTNSAVFAVSGLEAGASWQYSLDGGATWSNGSGSNLTVPTGTYAAGAIRVTQQDAAGNTSAPQGIFASALVVETTAPIVTGFSLQDGSSGAAITGDLTLTFSEGIQRGTGNIVLKTAEGIVVATYDAATSANLTFSGSTLTIDPTVDLSLGTNYMVDLAPGSVRDLAGNNYAGSTSYLMGTSGNDTLVGGDGVDSTGYTSNLGEYAIVNTGDTFTVSGPDGFDTLVNVERLVFADFRVALDIDGTAGQAYRLYQAAFDRAPDIPGLGYQMNDLDRTGDILWVANNFIASPEFQSTYGQLDNSMFVRQLYLNVLDREPEAGGWAYHIARIEAGAPRSAILIGFSESPENKANVIGSIEHGMIYTV